MPNNFHSLSVKACLEELKTSKNGLNEKEAALRLQKNGPNELGREQSSGWWKIFFKQFQNPFIYILLFAGAISLLLKEHSNSAVIFGAVFLNAFIGFVQEAKASSALKKLRAMVKYEAVVWRAGEERKIPASDLVIGDIFIIEAGGRISADARLIEAAELLVNESILTGESLPSEKNIEKMAIGAPLADRHNMVYAGTIAVSGRGLAAVTACGAKTEIGKISSLVSQKEEETPLQKRLANLAKFLGIMFLSVCAGVFFLGIFQGREIFEMFLVSVALAVSSIPEGLLISLTIILVVGMQRLLKNKVLTRKLIAAETLGSTTVICSDKTGTLTEGKMAVSHIVIGEREFEIKDRGSRQEGEEAKLVSLALQIGALCNNALTEESEKPLSEWQIYGTPTEVALLFAAYSSGLDQRTLLRAAPKIAEKQFSSADKFMISLHRRGEDFVLYEKGAPEIILEKGAEFYHHGKKIILTPEHKEKIIRSFENFTKKGFRVIGLAYREGLPKDMALAENISWPELDQSLVFVGFVALKDPLRPDAREAIELARRAGIRSVIITGDHQLTALAIGEEIGLKIKAEEIMVGEELDKISDEELIKRCGKINIYARVNPHHKMRIISALQKKGEIVAMTGDGINDAPALKAADIGIALGTGTDVAKEASDMILLDNNFKVIVLAVEEGRRIFSNLRKVITYLTSDAFCEIILVAGSIIFGAPLAILPAQILWINIINDGMPNFALAFEKGSPASMQKKPKGREIPLLNEKMKWLIFGSGLLFSFILLEFFIYLWRSGAEMDYLRSLIFAIVGAKSLIAIFGLRSLSAPIWRLDVFSNLYIWGAVFLSSLLLLAAIYLPVLQNFLQTVPLSWSDWVIVFFFSFANLFLIEATKYYFNKKEMK